jgi:uncharacterized metal-binding protein YceD (DUF177 family)
MLKIKVLSLKEGEHYFNYVLPPSEIELEEDFLKNNIHVDITVVKNIYQLELKVKFNTILNFECDRCLEHYDHLCEGEFELFYKPVSARDHDIDNDKDEDNIRFYPVLNNYLDITKDLRDYLMLSIPMRHVPEEIDGVCVVCKMNFDELLNKENSQDNINPVWKKLYDSDK